MLVYAHERLQTAIWRTPHPPDFVAEQRLSAFPAKNPCSDPSIFRCYRHRSRDRGTRNSQQSARRALFARSSAAMAAQPTGSLGASTGSHVSQAGPSVDDPCKPYAERHGALRPVHRLALRVVRLGAPTVETGQAQPSQTSAERAVRDHLPAGPSPQTISSPASNASASGRSVQRLGMNGFSHQDASGTSIMSADTNIRQRNAILNPYCH